MVKYTYKVEECIEDQKKYFVGTIEGSDSSIVGDTQLEVLEHLSEVADDWILFGKARHQAPEYKPHWIGKTPETDDVLQSALNLPKEGPKAEVKPKMKKKKVLEILAEYHHNDIVQLREELAVLKAQLGKSAAEPEHVNGKTAYNTLTDRTL